MGAKFNLGFKLLQSDESALKYLPASALLLIMMLLFCFFLTDVSSFKCGPVCDSCPPLSSQHSALVCQYVLNRGIKVQVQVRCLVRDLGLDIEYGCMCKSEQKSSRL